jgi:hypothetical protein
MFVARQRDLEERRAREAQIQDAKFRQQTEKVQQSAQILKNTRSEHNSREDASQAMRAQRMREREQEVQRYAQSICGQAVISAQATRRA